MEVDASGPADAGVGSDSDDDWDPVVAPGVVLRPHVLQWQPAKAAVAAALPGEQARADPLHDAAADEEDGRWVTNELLQPDEKNIRTTAAVLNCPGCFTPVCYQCQRHTDHARQW